MAVDVVVLKVSLVRKKEGLTQERESQQVSLSGVIALLRVPIALGPL